MVDILLVHWKTSSQLKPPRSLLNLFEYLKLRGEGNIDIYKDAHLIICSVTSLTSFYQKKI